MHCGNALQGRIHCRRHARTCWAFSSLIFWSLIVIVSLKYLGIVLRATNKGEGGILALMALAFPRRAPGAGRRRALLVALGVFGAALLYGDGMITPAITVLSAIERVESGHTRI